MSAVKINSENNNLNEFVAVSLFDGMSCLQIALNKIGIKPTKYYSSEIDKHAIHVTMSNFPNTIKLGDVRNINAKELGFVNLLAGGSPCQSFSFAGKRKGMSTKCEIEILTLEHYLELKDQNFQFEGQSYLFWEYIRILKELREINPEINFLLENVMMGEKWQKILTRAIGINPIMINSALVSAQNRKRLYWTNIGAESDGLFGDLVCKIPEPIDKGIVLKDVLEDDVDQKYYLSDKIVNNLFNRNEINEKKGLGFKFSPTDGNKKANTILNPSKTRPDDNYIVINLQPRCGDPKKGGTGQLSRSDGKTYCLDTQQSNAIAVKKVIQLNPSLESNGEQPYMQNRVYDINGINPALTTLWNGSNLIKVDPKIRRLTPIECERLQTVPDNYTNHVSDTQRYKMLGNGWTIDVIAHILSFLKINNKK